MYSLRNNGFDLLRFCAAFQVMFIHTRYHFDLEMNPFILNAIKAFPGVPIFFVISGFLISASYERSDSLQDYYWKRFLRIYPALWFCLIISILSVLLIFNINCSYVGFLKWIFVQISFFQFYNPDFLRAYGVGALNGSLWTIPVEIQFYIVTPFLMEFINKIRVKQNLVLISLILVFCLIRVIFIACYYEDKTLSSKLFNVSLIPHLFYFLIGITVNVNYGFLKKYLEGNAKYFLLIYFISLRFFNTYSKLTLGNHLNVISGVFLAFFALSFSFSTPDVLNKIFKGNDFSYGLYIFHMIVVNFFIQKGWINNGWISASISMGLSLALAVISWFLVEKRALRLKAYRSINLLSYGTKV